MRIEYEPTILDRILKAKLDARRENKNIRRIILTIDEAEEFRRETQSQGYFLYPHTLPGSPFCCQYAGIRIDVEPYV